MVVPIAPGNRSSHNNAATTAHPGAVPHPARCPGAAPGTAGCVQLTQRIAPRDGPPEFVGSDNVNCENRRRIVLRCIATPHIGNHRTGRLENNTADLWTSGLRAYGVG